MRLLKHDGIARYELLSESVQHCGTSKCKWCGQQGKLLDPNRPKHSQVFRLFKYGTLNDDSMLLRSGIEWHPGYFCNVSCFRCYIY